MIGKTDLNQLLKSMNPRLNDGEYIFCSVKPNSQLPGVQPVMQFTETEGITLIIERSEADRHNIQYKTVFSWITLAVHSSLEATEFTAAFSKALAKHQISCNVVAGYYHDHIFVPKDEAEKAHSVLGKLTE